MSTAAASNKQRHRDKRLGERRRDAGSSRDASEEDNDNDVSDVGSLISGSGHASTTVSNVSTASSSPRQALSSHQLPIHSALAAGLPPSAASRRSAKRIDELGGEGSQSEGLDSPTYDGDVESSSTVGGGTPVHTSFAHSSSGHVRRPSSPTPSHPNQPASISLYGKVPTPKPSRLQLHDSLPSGHYGTPIPEEGEVTASAMASSSHPTDVPVGLSDTLSPPRKSQIHPLSTKTSSAALGPQKMLSRPKELSEADIRSFVQRAIDGEGSVDGVERWWKTAKPPMDRPVRIYADGVYDLFHFGHALQLRQAKLSFPSVHLLVGCCSDTLCASHKSAPAMTHAERCESVRHCRWADEVLPDAPWVVDQAWMDKHQIDYIAHDELVYPSKDHEDVYGFAKEKGAFLPTRRTPAISTSDLLERIVRGYRDGFFDSKLEKNGLPELLAADVDWDSSASVERRERRKKKALQAKESAS